MTTLAVIGWIAYIAVLFAVAWYIAVETPGCTFQAVLIFVVLGVVVLLVIGNAVEYDIYGDWSMVGRPTMLSGIAGLGIFAIIGLGLAIHYFGDDIVEVLRGHRYDRRQSVLLAILLLLVQLVSFFSSVLGIISFYRDVP